MFRIVEIMTGVMIILIGLSLIILDHTAESTVQYGGVILIGPIPIIFGSSTSAIAFASIFLIIFVLFTLYTLTRWRW